jgi:hypothetical protein
VDDMAAGAAWIATTGANWPVAGCLLGTVVPVADLLGTEVVGLLAVEVVELLTVEVVVVRFAMLAPEGASRRASPNP